MNGLLKRGAFRIVLKEESGNKPNIVPSCFVLDIRHKGDGTTRYKARFVIGGLRDRDKKNLVHDSGTVLPESVRLLLALGTVLGLRVSVADWTQSYA